MPLYRDNIEMYKKVFPNFFHECPIKPGPMYVRDYVDKGIESNNQTDKNRYGFVLPNGRYRYAIKLFTKTDPLFYVLNYQIMIRQRLGEDVF